MAAGRLFRALAALALSLLHAADAARTSSARALAVGGARLAGRAAVAPDSKTIDGPDCGHAKQIIGKWQKASEVGKLAGAARGAITTADSAAATAQAAAARAKEVGAALAPDGRAAKNSATELAAAAAEAAAGDATAASAALDTELQGFKGKVSGSSFSGSDVTDAEMSRLRDLTQKARSAATLAVEAAHRAVGKAEEAQASAAKKNGEVGRLLTGLLSKANSALKDAADAVQKAGWAAKDAQVVEGKATEVLTEVDKKLQAAANQTAVWEALKGDLESKKAGLAEIRANVTADAGSLETTAASLKASLAPLEAAAEKVAGGNSAPSVDAEVLATEGLLDNTAMDTAALRAKLDSLAKREERLKAAIEEAKSRTSSL